jgi:hypothetical protein
VIPREFLQMIATAEMAQRVARRLGKPHGVFSDFSIRWVEAIRALEEELSVPEQDEATFNDGVLKRMVSATNRSTDGY